MLRLPEDLRPALREPIGPVLQTTELMDGLPSGGLVVTVGDVVTQTLLQNGRAPDIAVVDYQTQRGGPDEALRQAVAGYGDHVVRVSNPPGGLSDGMLQAIEDALNADDSTLIEVEGEEDMAALPIIAEAPAGTIVLYGMPNRGVVRVDVSAESRRWATDLLQKMQPE